MERNTTDSREGAIGLDAIVDVDDLAMAWAPTVVPLPIGATIILAVLIFFAKLFSSEMGGAFWWLPHGKSLAVRSAAGRITGTGSC